MSHDTATLEDRLGDTYKAPRLSIMQTKNFDLKFIWTFHSNTIGKTAEKTSVAAATKLVAMVFPRIAAEETQDPEPMLFSQYQLIGLHCTRRNMIP